MPLSDPIFNDTVMVSKTSLYQYVVPYRYGDACTCMVILCVGSISFANFHFNIQQCTYKIIKLHSTMF